MPALNLDLSGLTLNYSKTYFLTRLVLPSCAFFLFLFFTFVSSRKSSRGEESTGEEDDEVKALAPSRVLLGIALGLARASLWADAAKGLVKAAAVRPR